MLKWEIGMKPEDVQGNLPVYHAKNKGRMIATTAMFVGLVNIMLEDAKNDRREMAEDYIQGTGSSPGHNQRVP